MCKTKKERILNQIRLVELIQNANVNIVTCGDCGDVLLHETIANDDFETEIECPHCGFTSEPCDFPDLFYSGMENNSIYNEK